MKLARVLEEELSNFSIVMNTPGLNRKCSGCGPQANYTREEVYKWQVSESNREIGDPNH